MGAGATGPGGRRALELILSGGLKSLARPAKPVRRAASRDSVLSQPQPLLEGEYLSTLCYMPVILLGINIILWREGITMLETARFIIES